jgi:conserved inner membrane protein
MIREGLSSDDEPAPSLISLKHLLTLGVATSIDALAVGVSFAFLFP